MRCEGATLVIVHSEAVTHGEQQPAVSVLLCSLMETKATGENLDPVKLI